MAIRPEQLQQIAKLSKLQYDESLLGEFDELITFCSQVSQEVAGDTTTIKTFGSNSVAHTQLREDEVVPSLPSEKILSNVESEGDFFAVRRVVK